MRRSGGGTSCETDLAAGGVPGAVRAMVERARRLLGSGVELEGRVAGPLRLQLSLYRTGGLAICDAIEAMGYDTERRRPSVSGATKVSLLLRAALGTFSRGRPV